MGRVSAVPVGSRHCELEVPGVEEGGAHVLQVQARQRHLHPQTDEQSMKPESVTNASMQKSYVSCLTYELLVDPSKDRVVQVPRLVQRRL